MAYPSADPDTQWNVSSIWPLLPSDIPLQPGCLFLPPTWSLCLYFCQSLPLPFSPIPLLLKKRVILYIINNDPCNKEKQRKKTHNQTERTFPLLTPLLWQFSVTLRTPFNLSRSWLTDSISHGNTAGHNLTLCPTVPLQPHSLVLFHELRQNHPNLKAIWTGWSSGL